MKINRILRAAALTAILAVLCLAAAPMTLAPVPASAAPLPGSASSVPSPLPVRWPLSPDAADSSDEPTNSTPETDVTRPETPTVLPGSSQPAPDSTLPSPDASLPGGEATIPPLSDGLADTRVSGIFIAPELISDATQAEWNDTVAAMADIGIDTLIVQYCLQTDPLNGRQAYFPYSVGDTAADAASHPQRRHQIGYILSAAKNENMKVYLGLQLAEREWFDQNQYRSDAWLDSQKQLSLNLANELWQTYGGTYGSVIEGWYLPFEFESSAEYYYEDAACTIPHDYFPQLASAYYNPLTAALKSHSGYGSKSILISPLMYWADDKAAWSRHLTTVLLDSKIDIVAPQDGIGFGTQTHDTIGDWYRVTRSAIDALNTGRSQPVRLWGNCENYSRLRNPNESDPIERIKPMAIGKFIDSLNIVKPYVDNLITFSVHRWSTAFASDRELGVNRSYYDAYKRYVTTGERSASKTDGYYVHIRPAQGQTLIFNPYANAGLTDGLAGDSRDWSLYKGISSPGNQPFVLEIRFDDPTVLSRITIGFLEDSSAAIALPGQVTFEYLVRSGGQDQILTYTTLATVAPSGSGTVVSSAALPEACAVDGIRITIIPGGEWTFIDDIWAV